MQPTREQRSQAGPDELISFGSIADYTAGGSENREGPTNPNPGMELQRGPRGPRRFNHTDGQPPV